MTTLSSFNKTDGVDDHVAADVNNLIAASLRSEYKNVETLSATRALLDADTPIQRYECGAADRIVTAPAADSVNNHPYLIVNASAVQRALTFKNSAGSTTYATIAKDKAVLAIPDGNGGWVVLKDMDTLFGSAINLTSGQIAFPATQVPSSDANTLDDYEEGTWTPTAANFTVVGSPTYSGTYTKIGRLVLFSISCSSTTTIASTGGTSSLTGPFTAAIAGTCAAVNPSTVIGSANAGYAGTIIYPPTWAAQAATIVSGFYFV